MWVQIMSASNKTTSLKFALGRALLDISAKPERGREVSLEELAMRFIDYFWYQVALFRLRQSASKESEPLISRHLRQLNLSPGKAAKGPAILDAQTTAKIRDELIRGGFVYVLPCFHNVRRNRVENPRFYERKRGGIVINEEAWTFLRSEGPLLRDQLLFHWARWLENFNGAPRIASKLAYSGRQRRSSLRLIGQRLKAEQASCFYCPETLGEDYHVDHVIPWAYLFQDPLWDLVLACPTCNLRKSDTLPQREALGRLIERNDRLLLVDDWRRDMAHSLQSLPGYAEGSLSQALTRLFEAAEADGF